MSIAQSQHGAPGAPLDSPWSPMEPQEPTKPRLISHWPQAFLQFKSDFAQILTKFGLIGLGTSGGLKIASRLLQVGSLEPIRAQLSLEGPWRLSLRLLRESREPCAKVAKWPPNGFRSNLK